MSKHRNKLRKFFNKRYQTEIPAQYLTDGPGYRRCGCGSSRRFPGALSSLAGNHVETMRTSATTVNLQHYRTLEMHITRPHHRTMYADEAYCYRPSSVVCLSVCQSVTIMSCAKSAKPIEIAVPFGLWTRVGPRNNVLDEIQIALCEEAISGGKGHDGRPVTPCNKCARPPPTLSWHYHVAAMRPFIKAP